LIRTKPPVWELRRLLGNLETFMHHRGDMPALVHAGVAHAQFETIHPFIDGNGRIGRLLITFLLVHGGVISRPLLSLSLFLNRHRAEYYDRLTAVREAGDWEGWLAFFLRGVAETCADATRTAAAILALRDEHLLAIRDLPANAGRLLDHLYERPLVTAGSVASSLGVSWPTANKLLTAFADRRMVVEVTGQRRNRVYRYGPYLALFAQNGP
jgi:Fic family protein